MNVKVKTTKQGRVFETGDGVVECIVKYKDKAGYTVKHPSDGYVPCSKDEVRPLIKELYNNLFCFKGEDNE